MSNKDNDNVKDEPLAMKRPPDWPAPTPDDFKLKDDRSEVPEKLD